MKNTESTVFLVDDDHAVRDALVLLMETEHLNTESFADVSMSVQAFRSGAIDFMEKPFDENILLERIQEAIRLDQSNRKALDKQTNAESRLASLTRREDEIMWLIVAGKANKQIAAELDLSHRTVESHRGRIMEKTGAHSLPDLVKLARASRGSRQD
jgi:FixJ family two-component response regulator